MGCSEKRRLVWDTMGGNENPAFLVVMLIASSGADLCSRLHCGRTLAMPRRLGCCFFAPGPAFSCFLDNNQFDTRASRWESESEVNKLEGSGGDGEVMAVLRLPINRSFIYLK